MAEDGEVPGAVSVTIVPAQSDNEHNDHNAQSQSHIHVDNDKSHVHVSSNKLDPESHKSTFEELDSGMLTPMGGEKHPKHHGLEIDEYFVCI